MRRTLVPVANKELIQFLSTTAMQNKLHGHITCVDATVTEKNMLGNLLQKVVLENFLKILEKSGNI